MSAELKPKPLELKKKPGRGGATIEELEPAVQCTDVAKCSGTVYGSGVVVTKLQHVRALVKLGCYGKGMFSKSVPSHQYVPSRDKMKKISRKRKYVDREEMEMELLWGKRMKLHSQWKKRGQSTTYIAEEAGQGVTKTEGEGTTYIAEGMTEGEGTAYIAEVKEEEGQGVQGEGTISIMASMVRGESITIAAGEAKMEGERLAGDDVTEAEVATLRVDDDRYQQFISRLKAIKKDDHYPLEEYLLLSAEEAFYLAAEAGVLTIDGDETGTLTNSDLWLHFTSLSRSFCARYAAYSHYRTGNWVPKSGLKFGVDFLLYKESPLTYHSSFAVVVKEEGTENHNLTWKEVIALDRACESAKKDLLLCHVIWPEGVTKGDPRCIDRATITDILVKRWVPEKDR